MKQIEDKPRSIKELLQVMLDNQKYFFAGLCYWISDLKSNKIITRKEYGILGNYIESNKPFNFYTIFRFDYYWEPRNIKPRIKWIKKHIKRNS